MNYRDRGQSYILRVYIISILCRREGIERSENGTGAASQHSDKTRESHQRSPLRSARTLWRYSANVTSSAVNLMADGRADPIRPAVRGGAHRQSASGDLPGRHHVGDERHRHPPADLEQRAR